MGGQVETEPIDGAEMKCPRADDPAGSEMRSPGAVDPVVDDPEIDKSDVDTPGADN